MWPWVIACLVLAALFVKVWPEARARDATPGQRWALRWGHAAAWVLLALSALLQGVAGRTSQLAVAAGIAAAVAWVVFVVALVRTGD